MRELDKRDVIDIVGILDKYPIEGTFFRSDLEYFGIRSDFHRFMGVHDSHGELVCLILHYYNSVSILGTISLVTTDICSLTSYLSDNSISWVSGPEGSLVPLLDMARVHGDKLYDSLFLMTTDRKAFKPYGFRWKVEFCEDSQLRKAYDFVSAIPEFSAFPPFERFADECRVGIRKVFCVYRGKSIVGSSSIIGDNGLSGMIAAVSTRPEFRGKGIGKAVLSKATLYLLEQGKLPCLTQNHSESNSLYSKLGYHTIGKWQICEVDRLVRGLVQTGNIDNS